MSTTSSEPDRRARLSDFASNRYSQGGEDGMIAECLRRLRIEEPGVVVEYGAGDGLSCSNTAALWQGGWQAVLVEASGHLIADLVCATAGYAQTVTVVEALVRPSGGGSIDEILDRHGVGEVDVMSIDIDGDDYWHLLGLRRRPRLLLVEFNPTIPPHLDIQPRGPGNRMGVGILTLVRAAAQRGYTFVGASAANVFLVRTEDASWFEDLETDLAVLRPPEQFMYLATDYDGRVVPIGARPQWGLVWPPSETEFVPNQPDLLEVDTFNADERWKMQMVREIRAVHEKLDQTHDPVETFFPLEPLLPYPTAVESVGEQGAQAQTEAEGEGETPAEA